MPGIFSTGFAGEARSWPTPTARAGFIDEVFDLVAIALELVRGEDSHPIWNGGESPERLLQSRDAGVAVLFPLCACPDCRERLRLAQVRLLHPPVGVGSNRFGQRLGPRVSRGNDRRVDGLVVGSNAREDGNRDREGASRIVTSEKVLDSTRRVHWGIRIRRCASENSRPWDTRLLVAREVVA